MRNNKHIQSFNEHQENLNISDVSDSKDSRKELIKKIWDLAGYNSATGNEKRLPYKNEVPLYNRNEVKKLLLDLYNGEIPEWW